MHPLIDLNLGNLKEAELENKIQELSKKYFLANNPTVKDQIVMILEDYKQELQTRRMKQWQDQYQKRDTDLDSLINIS
jgi:hypothetical protein